MSVSGSAISSIVGNLAADVGTGINVQAVVQEIIAADSTPLDEMQSQQSLFSSQTSALQNISSLMSTLQTSIQSLSDTGSAIGAQAATSSNTDVVTATGSNTAVPGTHTIVVNNLATTSSYYTQNEQKSATSTLATGSFDIQMAGASSPTVIPVDSADGTNTLNGLASYINSQGLGVTANIITDSGGSRLSLVSNTSGAAGNFTVSSDTTGLGFTQPAANIGVDASVTVDGVPIDSSTNTVTSAIPGVTLNLLSAPQNTNVSVTVGPDTTQITGAINTFVSSYNAVVQAINNQYAVNSSSQQGVLASDSTLASVQTTLSNDINFSYPSNPNFINLASMGINMNDDGTLTIDSSTLNSSITTNYQSFVNFFQNSTSTGFAQTFNSDLNTMLSPAGLIATDVNGIGQSIQSLTDQISQFQANLSAQQTSLTTEFSQINATLEELPTLENQVTGELSGA
ncbi:MAG TPA: flagellar filament capping protein FliD [Candidatus Acidoferrales bacterium]|jgi:flagellar hook-associated protein 2|nr:flagellar filament capping protein FliD [Candidatus Acidoferrales bacterium]